VRVKAGTSQVTFRLLPLPVGESAVGGGSVTTAGFFSGSGNGSQFPPLETTSVAIDPSTMQGWPARVALGRPPVLLVQGLPLTSTQVAPMEVYHQFFSLVEALRQAGRDVWIIGLKDAKDPVAGNALAVSDAVAQLAALGDQNARVDVIGASLGGVIARYALAADEANNGPSKGKVRLFASIDAPHQGANINRGIQAGLWLAGGKTGREVMRSYSVQNFLYEWVGGDNWEKKSCGFPENGRIFGTPAAHDWFYGQLNALNGDGYPHLSRNVAVANGALATPRPRREGDVVYKARATAKVLIGTVELCSEEYKARPWDILPGSLLPANVVPTKAELGNGLRFDLEIRFEPAFIPTTSALDVRDDRSKFDAVFTPKAPAHHGELPPGSLDFLLKELLL
jgi:pimeloyl-ACP methyl ester carboxylesterase